MPILRGQCPSYRAAWAVPTLRGFPESPYCLAGPARRPHGARRTATSDRQRHFWAPSRGSRCDRAGGARLDVVGPRVVGVVDRLGLGLLLGLASGASAVALGGGLLGVGAGGGAAEPPHPTIPIIANPIVNSKRRFFMAVPLRSENTVFSRAAATGNSTGTAAQPTSAPRVPLPACPAVPRARPHCWTSQQWHPKEHPIRHTPSFPPGERLPRRCRPARLPRRCSSARRGGGRRRRIRHDQAEKTLAPHRAGRNRNCRTATHSNNRPNSQRICSWDTCGGPPGAVSPPPRPASNTATRAG